MDKDVMTKIINDNFPEGKIYIIHVTPDQKDEKNRLCINRINRGFNAYELIGLLEDTQLDILKQMAGGIRPDTIQRTVIEESRDGLIKGVKYVGK